MSNVIACVTVQAERLVNAWERQWQREGRLDGGLDRVARADLVSRISDALCSAEEPNTTPPPAKPAKGRRAQ